MRTAARSRAVIELRPEQDYRVLRGEAHAFHEHDSCVSCQMHPMAEVPSWPKTHQDFKRETLSGPALELVLLEPPTVYFPEGYEPRPVRRNDPASMGNILGDIFDFIESCIESILSEVLSLLKKILYDLIHPLQLLKDIIQATLDVFTGKLFLDALAKFPLTRWLYLGVDHLTGGFLTNLTTLTSLPGRFFTGQPIARSELLRSLSVLVIILAFAVSFLTGGATLAIIGLSVTLLKQGPLGKTALGRTLLDIAGIGLAAVCGGGDIVGAFISAGEGKLQGTAVGALAKKLHISGIIVGLVSVGASAASSGLNDEADEEEDYEDDEEDYNDSDESEPDSSQPSSAPGDSSQPSAAISDSSAEPSPDESDEWEESDDVDETDEIHESQAAPESDEEESDEFQDDSENSDEESDLESDEESGTDEGDDESAHDEEDSADDEEDDEEEDEEEDDEEEDDEEEDNSAAIEALKAAGILTKLTESMLTPPAPAPASKAAKSPRPTSSSSAIVKTPAPLKKPGKVSQLVSSVGKSLFPLLSEEEQRKRASLLLITGSVAAVAIIKHRKRSRS